MADRAMHGEARDGVDRPTGAREVWGLLAPGLGYLFLAAAAVLGLLTASGAEEDLTYATGLATFLVALLIAAMRMKRQFDGRPIGFLLPVTVNDPDTLIVTIAVLAILGIVGVVLAATSGGTLYGEGLALFVVAIGFIFVDLKRYFDARDREG
jgi:hypothetical protein